MCRNIETSLGTFAVTSACMGAIYYLRPTPEIKYIIWFVMTFTTMQLADALIWYSLGNSMPFLNQLTSQYLIPVILAAELVIAYYAAKKYLNWSNSLYEVLLWIVSVGLIISWIYDCMKDPVTKPGSNGYLVWCNKKSDHMTKIIFFVFLILPFVIAYPRGWIKLAFLLCAFSLWLWNYSNPAFGSRWCWSSNIFSIIVLILVALGKK